MGRLKEYFIQNPFMLAHHPSCDKFSDHTLNFGGLRLCMGCFVIYPTAAAALAVLYLASGTIQLDYMPAFWIALILFGVNAIRKTVIKDRLPKGIQIVFRIILGMSLAFMMASIWLAPVPEQFHLITLLLAFAIVYNLINGRKMVNTCKECPNYSEFPKCRGLKDIK